MQVPTVIFMQVNNQAVLSVQLITEKAGMPLIMVSAIRQFTVLQVHLTGYMQAAMIFTVHLITEIAGQHLTTD